MYVTPHSLPGPRPRPAVWLAVIATAVVLTLSVTAQAFAVAAKHDQHEATMVPATRAALHDAMRTLWEQHVAWTRLAIVSFAAGTPDLPATEARLLRNQVDIGNAIKPFYGRARGDKLSGLLEEHIRGAVALLQAAKARDEPGVAKAKAAWYANGRAVADFLNSANPRHWPRRELRAMMKVHLDQTLREAIDQLTGQFAASIAQYDAIERHILAMADTLSNGIINQFPRRLR